MKPVDKFGKPIFSRLFEKLCAIGKNLECNDWKESSNKPNLFYKKFEGIMIFADMRGTKEVPIWAEPYPLMYSQNTDKLWKNRKALRKASEELDSLGIKHRFSFCHDCELTVEEFEEITRNMENYDIDRLADGHCFMCGEDFNADGLFCSESCEKAFLQLREMRNEEYQQEIKCALCGKALDRWSKNTIEHHISYNPEKTIFVCRSCHRKIHARKADFPDLAPEKPKTETKEKKVGDETLTSEESAHSARQSHPNKFDAPSETFKTRKASRDRVKHPRY
jgi:hypothetical protein